MTYKTYKTYKTHNVPSCRLTLTLFLAGLASLAFTVNAAYDATGVRDPMVRPLRFAGARGTNGTSSAHATGEGRRQEIGRILAACRIEGVVISDNDRLVLINDKLLREGDRVSAECDVYVAKIEFKSITFSLDDQTVTYTLTPSKREVLP